MWNRSRCPPESRHHFFGEPLKRAHLVAPNEEQLKVTNAKRFSLLDAFDGVRFKREQMAVEQIERGVVQRGHGLFAKDKDRVDEEKIRELYYCAYSRQPDADELKLANGYLAKKVKRTPEQSSSTTKEAEPRPSTGKHSEAPPATAEKEMLTARRQAYEDILWALINTKEFLFNH